MVNERLTTRGTGAVVALGLARRLDDNRYAP